MPKMIQVRNVPDDLHRELRVRAARSGVSLSDYVLALAEADAATPPLSQTLQRIAGRRPMGVTESSAALVREGRDAR